jgi:NADPH2:quinone reductase
LTEARRAQELLGQGGVKGKLVLICNSLASRQGIAEQEQSLS